MTRDYGPICRKDGKYTKEGDLGRTSIVKNVSMIVTESIQGDTFLKAEREHREISGQGELCEERLKGKEQNCIWKHLLRYWNQA